MDNNERKNLEVSTLERDLGVKVSSDLKWESQVDAATAKANSTLATLKRTFVSTDLNLWKTLYTLYVRPQLEFASSVLSPSLKKEH